MKRRTLTILIVAAVLIVGWAVFRPELLFINKPVHEAFPVANAPMAADQGPVTLLTGSFRGLAHDTKGTATIHMLPGGKRVLRLTGFETSNGPDVRVLLVAAADAPDNDTVKSAGSVELGALKGNVGDQNYDVPADVDLSKYRAVVIWCNRFSVNFGTAPLGEPVRS